MKNAKRLAALFLTAAVLLTAGCGRKTVHRGYYGFRKNCRSERRKIGV